MPRLQVSSGGAVSIPGRPGRKKLTFRNINAANGGVDCVWGYEPTISGNLGDAACGVPLHADEGITMGDADGNQTAPIFFRTAAGGTVIYYTES